MSSRLNPYISFGGNAREAMEYYQSVLGGNLTLSTFSEFGDPHAEAADKVIHAMLETDKGFTLMGADCPPGKSFNPGDNMTVSLSGDDADNLHAYWDKLSDGGTVSVPLERQMWGDEFGQCVDRFGVAWMVNIAEPQG